MVATRKAIWWTRRFTPLLEWVNVLGTALLYGVTVLLGMLCLIFLMTRLW